MTSFAIATVLKINVARLLCSLHGNRRGLRYLMKQCVQTQMRDKFGTARRNRDNRASRERSQFSWDTPLKIGTVPANLGRMVTLKYLPMKIAVHCIRFRASLIR